MKSLTNAFRQLLSSKSQSRRRSMNRSACVGTEALEQRQVMSASSFWMSGSMLVVKTNYRVDADLPVDSSRNSNPSYAHRGEDNSMWVAIFEKAWAHYRRGQNSYSSIDLGRETEVFRAMGISGAQQQSFNSFSSAIDLFNAITDRLLNGDIMTISFIGNGSGAGLPIVLKHAYSVDSFTTDLPAADLCSATSGAPTAESYMTPTHQTDWSDFQYHSFGIFVPTAGLRGLMYEYCGSRRLHGRGANPAFYSLVI